ncbi:zinc finger and SCAN domain-containing protein 2-like [Dreissena polymorpha]|uniref:C2H2-type domain-containing protein n=1 Tax=Dreissena polymorpha TaxID=45954 RepID=A0A9D4DYK2_DREPO|nr:zinc finger and SCAN domain-containing protein 2-like [Dreissena polymorpha]XP_052230092.1 zinc finger and SCAN domain-containing protein 2-like [Dreissena polymorpha]KAH3769966.1 hypothetical protein DPMN_171245 [Dreissena polymorpha]
MDESSVIKTEMDGIEAGTSIGNQQLITVQTPGDNRQLILVNFTSPDGTFTDNSSIVTTTVCDSETQTETVFGLEDLPVVKEIVRKTIAKARKHEREQMQTQPVPDMLNRAVNGIFTCPICAKVYRNKLSWQNHLVSHNGSEVFMCGVCGQLFNVYLTLKAHLDVHFKEEKQIKRQRDVVPGSANMKIGGVYMPGDVVPTDRNDISTLQQGLDSTEANPDLLHHDNVPLDTPTSTESYVAATEEVTDMVGDTGDDDAGDPEAEGSYVYACNICGEQYMVKEDCERHLKVHTGEDDIEDSPSSVEEPMKPEPMSRPDPVPSPQPLEHRITSPNKPKFSSYIYACNVCGRQYTNKSNCKRHMMIHTDDRKLYECEFCLKRFSQKYEVRMHSRIHTGEKPYSCAVCGKTFTERGNWRRHTQIHVRPQETSPYRCGICCKGFFHAEKLQVHLQIHSGQRPFVCTVCGRKVKKIGDMYRHLRTHTGEKPYKCQVCGKGFAQNGNLKDHMKIHTGEKPHICELCGKDFARKILLKEHIKHHHKGATLQDLTEAALEEIERQEAAMESAEASNTIGNSVIHEIVGGNIPRLIRTSGGAKTIIIGGHSVQTAEEAQILQEEEEMELHEVHSTLTAKELEAAEVLTVVQDGQNMVYTITTNSDEMRPLDDGSAEPQYITVTSMPGQESTEVQNS